VLEVISKLKLKKQQNHFSILVVYFPAYNIQAYETTFETTSKTSGAVQYLTSLITLKARTSVPDQCKDDNIERGMSRTATNRLLTRGLSFLPTPSYFTRHTRLSFTEVTVVVVALVLVI